MKYLALLVAALVLTGCGLLGHAEPWERAVLEDPAATPEARQEAIASIESRTADGIVTATEPWVPAPLKPLVGPLVVLAVGLAFKRSREHILNATKNVVVDMPANLARAVGLKHTTDDPEELAARAEALRLKRGTDRP
jgi:hypothetical protein